MPTVRNLHSALNPAIKSLNYLNNIMAKIEANNAGVEEAVMLNAEGFVAECTGDNLFIVKNRALFTPPLSAGALYGITRQTVIQLAEEAGLKVSELKPDARPFVQRGRMFPDPHGRGFICGEDRRSVSR